MISSNNSSPNITNGYSITELKKFLKTHENPSKQALAIEYARMGFRVFPCDVNKNPISDHSLSFIHGFKDATDDLKLTVKTWHRYPNAGIGLALPEDVIVIDCDIRKDGEHKPILKNGMPDMIGLKSFQNLIIDLKFSDSDLDTLSVVTQSGGRHFYYQMPQGTISFNKPHVLEGLDIKGYGGYVILPNSAGKYGNYKFLNLTEIREIPESLLNWVMKFKRSENTETKIPDPQDVNDSQIIDFTMEILPAWNSAVKKHVANEMRLAIAGTLYHYGWPESKADQVMKLLIARSEVKGLSDKNAVHYTYTNGNAGKPVYGFSTLKQLITEIEEVLK